MAEPCLISRIRPEARRLTKNRARGCLKAGIDGSVQVRPPSEEKRCVTYVFVRASSHSRPSFSSTTMGSTHADFGKDALLRHVQELP